MKSVKILKSSPIGTSACCRDDACCDWLAQRKEAVRPLPLLTSSPPHRWCTSSRLSVSPSVYPPLGQGIVAFWWKQILFLAGGEGAQFRCVYTLHMRADVFFFYCIFIGWRDLGLGYWSAQQLRLALRKK